jgi:hypothetical protein
MKIILKENTEKRLSVINLDEELYDNYHGLSEIDRLIVDAGMYADRCYCENEFDDLDEWCKIVVGYEYDGSSDYTLVKNKITQMLELNLIEIK